MSICFPSLSIRDTKHPSSKARSELSQAPHPKSPNPLRFILLHCYSLNQKAKAFSPQLEVPTPCPQQSFQTGPTIYLPIYLYLSIYLHRFLSIYIYLYLYLYLYIYIYIYLYLFLSTFIYIDLYLFQGPFSRRPPAGPPHKGGPGRTRRPRSAWRRRWPTATYGRNPRVYVGFIGFIRFIL